MNELNRIMYEEYIKLHKHSPTFICYRYKDISCRVCLKLKLKDPCEILACIDCNQHIFPEDFKHLTNFK